MSSNSISHNVGRLYEGIFKIRYMEELIKLKKYYEQRVENVKFKNDMLKSCWHLFPKERVDLIEIKTFSEFIEKLDLILNNSVVKPSERRSPTDESFSGCKPPDERQNPQEKILVCTCIYRTEKDKKFKIGTCEYCKQEFLNLLKGWK